MMSKLPVSTLVLVCTTQQDVLLLRRADSSYFWQSVTGSVEQGEALKDTAVRELFEETGLNKNQGELIDCNYSTRFKIWPAFRHRYEKNVLHNTEHAFLFVLSDKNVNIFTNTREHIEYIWLNKRIAYALATSPSNKYLINRYV